MGEFWNTGRMAFDDVAGMADAELELRRFVVSPFSTNCYAVVSCGKAMVVDPGAEGGTTVQRAAIDTAALDGTSDEGTSLDGEAVDAGADRVHPAHATGERLDERVGSDRRGEHHVAARVRGELAGHRDRDEADLGEAGGHLEVVGAVGGDGGPNLVGLYPGVWSAAASYTHLTLPTTSPV